LNLELLLVVIVVG